MAAFMRGMSWHLFTLERSALMKTSNDYIVESKRYVRALKRKPVKVLYPDSETTSHQRSNTVGKKISQAVGHKHVKEPNVKHSNNFKTETSDRNILTKSSSIRSDNASSASKHATTSNDQLAGLRFETAFPGDKRLARVVSIARSRTFREQQGKILLEGKRLICDALEAGANPQMVFFSSEERLSELPLDKLKRATLVKVKFEDIKIWSSLVSPQGVIAIFSRPDPSRLAFPERGQSLPLSLICDNVRDPGNLGTILRCAAAAGCLNVLLTKGCVDAWEPKVLRAAMGAHFRLPIFPSLHWDDVQDHLLNPVTVHVADNCSGSEGQGEAADSQGASQSNLPSKPGDCGWVSNRPNRKHTRYQDYDSDSDTDDDSDEEDEELSLPTLETKLYHESWAQGSSAVVIGGETHGLSLKAVQLAERTSGQRLFIPLVAGVDSLNSAVAASILLFEGRRQLLNWMETSGRKAKSELQRQLP